MNKIISITLIPIATVITLWIGYHMAPKVELASILSPDDYCRSEGYDFAEKQDISEANYPFSPSIPRVKCAYQRNGTDGKPYRGFAWYQYPPKTDLENYCNGDLKKSATVINPI